MTCLFSFNEWHSGRCRVISQTAITMCFSIVKNEGLGDMDSLQKDDWLCVPVFAQLAVADQRIHEILSFVHFSLNCKAAFHCFSRSKLSRCFFSESVQSRLHMRLCEQGIPFQFFFVGVVVTDFRKRNAL